MTSTRPEASSTDAPEPLPGAGRRLSSRHLSLGLVPVLAGGFLASCGNENAYCVDEARRVVDNQRCDDETRSGYYGGHFWAFTGGRSFGRGQTVDQGAERIAAADRTALAQKGGFGRATTKAGGTGKSISGGRSHGGFGSFGG